MRNKTKKRPSNIPNDPLPIHTRDVYTHRSILTSLFFPPADNYAWLITNYFVRRRWPTDPLRYLDDNTPKLLPPTKKRNVQHQQQKRQDAAPAADDIKWPRNCKWDTQPIAVQCEEINMDYEEYVADLSSLSYVLLFPFSFCLEELAADGKAPLAETTARRRRRAAPSPR